MQSVSKPRWQQVTALVSLSAGGAITGFSFVPRAAADITSPTSMPIRLLALKQSAQPAPADDAMLRSAIVNVTNYYLRMAKEKTPAEMEAIIWQRDSIDGADHGESCAAFASLTLELAAQVVGQQSWVTGGASYPWPLHDWADVRVDPNPASLKITSVFQDAEAHHRWHPLGDGYEPLPGDWVLFNGHVEVVTKYAGGVLHTVGADSLPDFSVNAHEYPDPLGAQGVVGFVNNGEPGGTASKMPHRREHVSGGHRARGHAAAELAAIPGASTLGTPTPAPAPPVGGAAIPAMPVPVPSSGKDKRSAPRRRHRGHQAASHGTLPPDPAKPGKAVNSAVPGAGPSGPAVTPQAATPGTAAIPGVPAATAHRRSARSTTPPAAPATAPAAAPSAPPPTARYGRQYLPSPASPVRDTSAQQAFIDQVAPGAVAAQRRYGVPAAVTIAQAIDESGWGQSTLATEDHNLFGIKGTGPAGSDAQPSQEYHDGQLVTRTAPFRVYNDVAESIDDHGRLLATSEYYRQPMADRQDPNAFAAALTGVYATDPDYGAKLIRLMRQYNLYRYDIVAAGAPAHAATAGGATIPGLPHTAPAPPVSTSAPARSPRATPATGRHADAYRAPSKAAPSKATPSTQTASARRMPASASRPARKIAYRNARAGTSKYQQHIPPSVRNSFIATARVPLVREEPLYRDVASHSGIRWELLAACDWMQCEAQPRYSPVHGEKLGTVNPDGMTYRTKSEALEQCSDDLAELAWAVYQIDLTARANLSVRDLANVFAAFRWGGLLKLHHTSAMEFPYSVAGLTVQHINMRWPNIDEPNTPDKPGGRFRMPFGAVPIVLGLNYPATV
jgi:flagellum-specific peptidoglycan hydrolase FlgJ